MNTSTFGDLPRFQTRLSRRLLAWSLASLLGGTLLVLLTSGFWEAFGIQALAWGGVDALIALAGLAGARKRPERGGHPERTADDGERRARRLRRVLWINTGLDLLYVTAGVGVAVFLGGRGPAWAGHGWGVVLQGAFLLFFDLIHAQSVPTPIEAPPQAFSGPEHLPFRLDGAPGGPGALLVHGFPGTPAEMRPLAELLHREGWSVRAPLLPGFGPQIARIAACRQQDWLQAVQQELAEMRGAHDPLLLVGYSLGGALSAGAIEQPAGVVLPDGLVLLAPFWRLGSALQRLVGRLLAPFLPRTFQPLAKADFSEPRLKASLQQFLPSLDLEDPAVQRGLRDTRVPLSILREIFAAGAAAFSRRSARRILLPALVIQGQEDTLISPARTRRLLRRLGRRPRYREVDAGHDLVDPRSPGWPELAAQVREFAAEIAAIPTAADDGSNRGLRHRMPR